ncbi:hypothetical protein H6G91_11910 [Nostoc muscorum FACHB-395]|nr:hypothetical protein [Desmonostoc muscorum FACHB-395]
MNNFDDSDTCGGNRLVLSISTSLDGTVVEVQLLYGTLRERGSKLRYIECECPLETHVNLCKLRIV